MTYDVVTAALAELCAAHPNLVDRKPEQSQEASAWSDAPPMDTFELHQRLTEDLPSTAEALVACEAATSSWDDERRWDQLAGAVSAVVQEWPDIGLGLLDAVGRGHPLIDQAVIRGWIMSQPDAALAPRILDRIGTLELGQILGSVTAMVGGFAMSGSTPVEWFEFTQSEELAKTCWELMGPAAPSNSPSVDDYTMSAINHPAGHLAEFWVQRVSHLWRTTEESWRGIPAEIAEYLAELVCGENSRSEAAQVTLCRYLYFFHQADADWCRRYLFPLFDWGNPSQAQKAWSGYLSRGSWTNQLLADGFLEMLVATVSHRDQLDKPGQRNLLGLLAKLAVAADGDPLPWIRELVTGSSVSDRVAWSQAIRHQLDTLGADAVEQQWERWIHVYVSDRVSSIPRRLEPEESSAMASWPLFLSVSMVSAIELMLRTENTGLGLHDLFLHDLGDDQITRSPEKVAQLLLHMLKTTDGEFDHARKVENAYSQFKSSGVSAEILRQIAEEAMRLGITLE